MHRQERIRRLNAGVYPPSMAGALAGVTGHSIGQWVRHGLITATVHEGRPVNLYSYFDVAEAIVVRWLASNGVRFAAMRDAVRQLRREWPEWPLLEAPLGLGRWSPDDRPRLVRREARDVYVEVAGGGRQVVIKPTLLDRARDMLAYGGWLASEHGLDRIEVDPFKLGGAPSLRDRRWTLEHVARLGADGDGRRILTDRYGLTTSEIDEAGTWMAAARELAA